MSWYVRNILMDSEVIRSKIAREVDEEAWEIDLEDNEYMDLLSIEIKIKQLKELGIISDLELKIIQLIQTGSYIRDIEKEIGLSRTTIYKIFKDACNKISFSLGDYFSDDGYINYITNKYSLQEDEINKIIFKIKGKN